MAITVETPIDLAHHPEYRRVTAPNHLYLEFTADDTDQHQLKVSGQGKQRMTVFVSNPSDTDVMVTVYGMHAIDALIGGVGVQELGGSGNGSFIVATTEEDYECFNDPFPFYLIDVTYGSAPGDAVKKTTTVYIDFHQA